MVFSNWRLGDRHDSLVETLSSAGAVGVLRRIRFPAGYPFHFGVPSIHLVGAPSCFGEMYIRRWSPRLAVVRYMVWKIETTKLHQIRPSTHTEHRDLAHHTTQTYTHQMPPGMPPALCLTPEYVRTIPLCSPGTHRNRYQRMHGKQAWTTPLTTKWMLSLP